MSRPESATLEQTENGLIVSGDRSAGDEEFVRIAVTHDTTEHDVDGDEFPDDTRVDGMAALRHLDQTSLPLKETIPAAKTARDTARSVMTIVGSLQ